MAWILTVLYIIIGTVLAFTATRLLLDYSNDGDDELFAGFCYVAIALLWPFVLAAVLVILILMAIGKMIIKRK